MATVIPGNPGSRVVPPRNPPMGPPMGGPMGPPMGPTGGGTVVPRPARGLKKGGMVSSGKQSSVSTKGRGCCTTAKKSCKIC